MRCGVLVAEAVVASLCPSLSLVASGSSSSSCSCSTSTSTSAPPSPLVCRCHPRFASGFCLLVVIPAKAGIHSPLLLLSSDVALARQSREGGDPWTFHALPSVAEKRKAKASVRLKPAGSLFFADPKKSNPKKGSSPTKQSHDRKGSRCLSRVGILPPRSAAHVLCAALRGLGRGGLFKGSGSKDNSDSHGPAVAVAVAVHGLSASTPRKPKQAVKIDFGFRGNDGQTAGHRHWDGEREQQQNGSRLSPG